MSSFAFSRRQFVKWAAGAAAAPLLPRISLAANPTGTPVHGLSAFGELKYAADFTGFDYASPEAPRGGKVSFAPPNWGYNQNVQTFNTLNTYVLQGAAPPRMELCFDTLMASAWDEPDALYGLLAKTVTISEDRNTYLFELRPEARFADGSPVTAHDLAFSAGVLKEKGHPQLALDLANLESAQAKGDHQLELVFNGRQSGRAILSIAASLPALSRRWYEGREFEAATDAPPLSSGRYKVGRFSIGRFIEFERRADYWGENLPVMAGIDRFDTIRIEFFQERQAAFEAFKKGVIDIRQEFTSKTWATEYNFPAVTEGRVRQLEFPEERTPSMQAFALNTRREKFAHPDTRRAIATLFDFEWTNRNLFYGAYVRSHSLFEMSDLKAQGTPEAAELALLEPLRGQLPAEAFGEPAMQFVSDGTGRDRRLFREADRLFAKAGWRKDGGRLIDAAGRQLDMEVLINSQNFERILAPFAENLRTLGVAVQLRQVDPSQYQSRIEIHDFDMMMVAYNVPANPAGEFLRRFFHSSSAARNGTQNHPGIADPAIDALVEHASAATSRDELVVAMRALDRALRAGQYWIPNWHSANHRVAAWDMFGWKEPKPDYAFPIERLWWLDPDKARAIGRA